MSRSPYGSDAGRRHAGAEAITLDWCVTTLDNGQRHVTPNGDLVAHLLTPACWCVPMAQADCPSLYAHHAADERERFERGDPAAWPDRSDRADRADRPKLL